jgi:hypothetical protein
MLSRICGSIFRGPKQLIHYREGVDNEVGSLVLVSAIRSLEVTLSTLKMDMIDGDACQR